jgi:superfamily II DNA or RNA helicase
MMIRLTNRVATLVRATPEERDYVRGYLSIPDPQAFFKGKEEATYNLYTEATSSFFGGFLPGLRKAAAAEGFTVEIVDNRVQPVARDPAADLAWLRDYQREAVDAVDSHVHGIIWQITGCLVGDTSLVVNRGGAARPVALKTLVSRMRGEATRNHGGKGRTCAWDLSIPTYTQSVDPEGYLRLNQIVNVHDNGEADVFCLKLTDGRSIRGTADHRFLQESGEYTRLGDLAPGDEVMIIEWPKSLAKLAHHDKVDDYELIDKMYNHPYAQWTNWSRTGKLVRVPKHRLVAEARLNNINLFELVGRIILNEIEGLTFLGPEVHVHHKDENRRNNDPDNLEVLPRKEHLAEHGRRGGWKNVSGRAVPAVVASITPCGREPVYDLTMASPMSNYVANEFVVHNSGKSDVAVGLTRAFPCHWLFMAPSLSLVNSMADRFVLRNTEHGVDLGEPGRIGEGRWTEGARLTCATYQSIQRSLANPSTRALLERTGGLVVDECFVAGTPVGDVPIEAVRVGDYVPSFDTDADPWDPVQRRVLRTMRRRPEVLTRVWLSTGESFVCTPSHKFWTPCRATEHRWTPAESLEGHLLVDAYAAPVGAPPLVRVDRVQALHPGADGTFEGACPDGYVYDLEVEGTHTFLVGSGIVVHNCHQVPARTFLEATRACNAYWRVGLSSTPMARGDMKSALTMGVTGPVIHRYTAQQAIAAGVVSTARVRMITVKHPNPAGYTYAEVYQELIARSAQRNAMAVAALKKAAKPAIAFVKHIQHGRTLLKLLQQAGISAEFVWGTHKAAEIERHINDLRRGDTEVIVSSAVLRQGIDVPELRTVVNLSAGRSVIDVLQKLGRGSRVERDAAGNAVKTSFELVDFYDISSEWLEDHAKKRRRAYLGEGYSVVVEGEIPRKHVRADPARVSWGLADAPANKREIGKGP